MKKWDLNEAIEYYRKDGAPQSQDALIALLREVQEENEGVLPSYMIREIAKKLKIKESFLMAIIKRYPSLRLDSAPNFLEVCGGPNCAKNNSAKLMRFIMEKYKVESGGISEKGKFAYKIGGCMKHCGKGPNIRWNGEVYNKMDEKKLVQLIEKGKIEGINNN